jgi:hypothetical protein
MFYYINSNKLHMLHSLFYVTTVLHISGVSVTHLQEHKTTVTTTSGSRYTVIDRVKFADKYIRLKLEFLLIMYILRKMQYIIWNNEWCTYTYCCLLLSWKVWNWFECVGIYTVEYYYDARTHESLKKINRFIFSAFRDKFILWMLS